MFNVLYEIGLWLVITIQFFHLFYHRGDPYWRNLVAVIVWTLLGLEALCFPHDLVQSLFVLIPVFILLYMSKGLWLYLWREQKEKQRRKKLHKLYIGNRITNWISVLPSDYRLRSYIAFVNDQGSTPHIIIAITLYGEVAEKRIKEQVDQLRQCFNDQSTLLTINISTDHEVFYY